MWTVSVGRARDTGDSQDLALECGKSYKFAWAGHTNSDQLRYHNRKGYFDFNMPSANEGCGKVAETPNTKGDSKDNTASTTSSAFNTTQAIKLFDDYYSYQMGNVSKALIKQPNASNYQLNCQMEKDCMDGSMSTCCAVVNLSDKSG